MSVAKKEGFRPRWTALRPLLSLPIVTLFASGCTTGDIGGRPANYERIQRGVDTTSTVCETLGTPDNVVNMANDRTMLIYQRQVEKGLTLGGGISSVKPPHGYIPILTISHSHKGSDSTYVIIGADGTVEDVGVRDQSDLVSYGLWPFGDP